MLGTMSMQAMKVATCMGGEGSVEIDLPEAFKRHSLTIQNMLEDLNGQAEGVIPLPISGEQVALINDLIVNTEENKSRAQALALLDTQSPAILNNLLLNSQYLDIELTRSCAITSIVACITSKNFITAQKILDDFDPVLSMPENYQLIFNAIPLAKAYALFLSNYAITLQKKVSCFVFHSEKAHCFYFGANNGLIAGYSNILNTTTGRISLLITREPIKQIFHSNRHIVATSDRQLYTTSPTCIIDGDFYTNIIVDEGLVKKISVMIDNTVQLTVYCIRDGSIATISLSNTALRRPVFTTLNKRYCGITYQGGDFELINLETKEIVKGCFGKDLANCISAENGNFLGALTIARDIIVADTTDYASFLKLIKLDTDADAQYYSLSLTFSRDGSCIAALDYKTTLHIWETKNGQLLYLFPHNCPRIGIPIIAFNATSTWVALNVGDDIIYIYPLIPLEYFCAIKLTMEQKLFIYSLANFYSPSNRLAVTAEIKPLYKSLNTMHQFLIKMYIEQKKKKKKNNWLCRG